MKQAILADDHALMLDGLRMLLQPKIEVVGIADNGRALIEQAEYFRPDLILLDISMPVLNGIEAARRLSRIMPPAKLIFVTQHLDSAYVRAAFEAGASAYVAKQSASNELRTAIHKVFSNLYYVSPLLRHREMNAFSSAPQSNPAEMFGARLTQRQRDVLQLIAEGKTGKEISSALNISEKTVEFHRNGIANKLGLRSIAELTRYAMRIGLVGV